jgi:hypothetical protein
MSNIDCSSWMDKDLVDTVILMNLVELDWGHGGKIDSHFQESLSCLNDNFPYNVH